MAVSLTEAAKFTTNMVKKGVIEEILKDSVVMNELTFKTINGNALQYLRETTLPTADFYLPGELWAESTPTWTQVTATLKIMGGDADVDNFIQATRSNYTDIAAETIAKKAKSVKHKFLEFFYYGDSATNTRAFDGLHKMFADGSMSAQSIHVGAGAAGAALAETDLDDLYDLVKDGKGDVILTTRQIRKRIVQYLRAANVLVTDRDKYGNMVASWNGVPIHFDDFLLQTETIAGGTFSASTGGATGSLFYLRFDEDGLCGLQHGGIETVKLGQLETKDAKRWRIKWYVGLMIGQTVSCARIDGVTNAVMTAT